MNYEQEINHLTERLNLMVKRFNRTHKSYLFNFEPSDDWKTILDHVLKILKKYPPRDVSEVIIDPGLIKINVVKEVRK